VVVARLKGAYAQLVQVDLEVQVVVVLSLLIVLEALEIHLL
jgi:hypothetical protein